MVLVRILFFILFTILTFTLITGASAQLTIPTPPLPPFLDNLTVIPPEIERGDNVTIGLDIMNPNNRSITYIVTIRVEGVCICSNMEDVTMWVDVELGAYESETVQHTITPDVAGGYNVTVDGMTGSFTVAHAPLPAEFFISELEAVGRQALVHDDEGRPIVEGEYVIFNVLVENIGETEGTYTVEFKVRRLDRQTLWDEEMIDTLNVTLAAGRGRRAFTYYEALNTGTYQVSVGDLTDTFTVRAPLEPAEFVFSNLQITPRVKIGMSVNISVDVTNVGEMMGFCTFELKLNGRVVDSVEIPSFGGEVTATQFFELTRGEGTYEVEVGGLTGSFTVARAEPSFWDKIPGFPYESIIIGLIAVIIIIWRARKF